MDTPMPMEVPQPRGSAPQDQRRDLSKPLLMVVDDEQLIRWSLGECLKGAGYAVLEASTGAEALEKCEDGVDLVLLDYRLPDTDGIAVLSAIKERWKDTVVILMTAYSTVESAVSAIQRGAYHYLNKPFEHQEMLLMVEKALESTSLKRELRAFYREASEPYTFEHIIGESPVMLEVKALLRKVASSPASTVLFTGESGSGKDLAAKVIHFNSHRATRRFMNITCSALPESLLESELFGHERGAFTDAKRQKQGLFELANEGTVFLDEIAELSPALQAKLLRFLEEKTFKRVGGVSDIRVDVRVIAATNRDLKDEVQERRFREDLFYRLNVLPVHLPALRERTGDIPRLSKYFIDRFNREFHKNVRRISKDAQARLESYPWPGNVRELRNALERAMLLAESGTLELTDFPGLAAQQDAGESFRLPSEGVDIEWVERDLVRQALDRTGWNQTKAAELLGLNRDKIRYRIQKYGLREGKS